MKFPTIHGKVILAVFATSSIWIIATILASSWSSQSSPWFTSGPRFPTVCPSNAGHNNRSNEFIKYDIRTFETEAELLRHAFHAALGPLPPGPPRIAFLFLVRGEIPFESVWQKFFKDYQDLYSLYVHASPGFLYPPDSFFAGKEIPSKLVERMSVTLLDAVRRMLAYALADPRYNNAWFVNVCEATIPIRGFPFVYQYLTGSTQSFVESFLPDERYQNWDTMPEFPKLDLRKGETWMQMNRKHAAIVVADRTIYARFVAGCTIWCAPDEEYFQTLLHVEDCGGIANRTLMYVDWTDPEHGASPRKFESKTISVTFLRGLQERTKETDGLKQDCASKETVLLPSCEYNGMPNSVCYLFARKFDPAAASVILDVVSQLPGY